MNITALGDNWVSMNYTVDATPPTFEVWAPDDGEPDLVIGDNGNAWVNPTEFLNKTSAGLISLQWNATSTTPTSSGGGGGSLLLIITMIFIAILLGSKQR